MTETPESTETPPLLDAMLHLLDDHAGKDILISDMLDKMGGRGFGFAFIVFGMLAAVLPTGVCSIMSAPILLFSAQLFAGHAKPGIPQRFNKKRFSADSVQAGLLKTRRWLHRMELLAKPRWPMLTGPVITRLAAFFCFVLALVILVPGPLTNLPPGITIALFGFAMAERDGLLMLVSFVVSLFAFFISMSAITALAVLAWAWLSRFFM